MVARGDAHKEETGSINLNRKILSRDFAQLISVQVTLHNNSLLKIGFSSLLCTKRQKIRKSVAYIAELYKETDTYCANLDDVSRENCVFQPDRETAGPLYGIDD